MNEFEGKVIEFNNEHRLIEKGDSVLIGVSGGVDSMALLVFLMKQQREMDLKIHVAHFNHMFRGAESDNDEKLVKDFCDKNSIAFVSIQKDIPRIISDTGDNSQLTSRNHRYEFYQEVIEEKHLDKLLLAHHLDDLAENVLMNLIRGVDSPRKIGIPVTRKFGSASVVRPFMCVDKEEIRRYLENEGIAFREDSSNKSMKYTRNRIRMNVIPLLKEENAKSLEHLAKVYEQIKADDEYIQKHARLAFDKTKIGCDRGIYSVEIKAVLEVDKTLQRRLFQLILEYVFSVEKSHVGNKYIDGIIEMAKEAQSSSIFKIENSFIVEKSFDKLLFYSEKMHAEYFELDLVLPGVTLLPSGDNFTSEPLSKLTDLQDDEYVVSKKNGEMIVRSRLEGDRVEVNGLGHKKLKKLFSEKKMPIYQRDECPILSKKTEKEDILWVPHVFKKKIVVEDGQLFKIKYKKSGV